MLAIHGWAWGELPSGQEKNKIMNSVVSIRNLSKQYGKVKALQMRVNCLAL